MNNDINFQPPEDNPGDGGLNDLNDLNDLNGLNGGADETAFDLPETGMGGTPNLYGVNAGGDGGEAPATKEEIDEAAGKHKFKITDYSISGIWKAVKDYWLGLQLKTKIFAVSSTAAMLIFIVVLTVMLNRSPFVKTFIGLESDREALEITNILKENNIQSKYDSMFKTISVKEKDMDMAVMIAAERSYPQTGFLYDEETSSNILETQQEKQDRELRNRQKRLEASLGMMTGIESAIVNLNIPDNSRSAITREIQPSSASVMLYTKTGYTPSSDTIKGIENMIQKSIANLSVDDINIIDQNGIILNNYQESETAQYTNWVDIKRDFEREQEKNMYNTLWNLLSPAYGVDGVTIACNVDSDFDEFIREAKNFTGTNVDENDQQSGIPSALAKDHSISSGTDSGVIGQAVTDMNVDADGYYENPGDYESGGLYSDDYHFTEEYLVNYVLEQLQRRTPAIKNKSVTIFIDADELDPDEEERLLFSLGMAVGINDLAKKDLPPDEYILDVDYLKNYVSIFAVPFNHPDAPDTTVNTNIFGFQPIQILMALAFALIVIIIMAIIIISVMNRRKEEREEAIEREESLLAADGTSAKFMPGLTPFGLAAGRYAAAEADGDDDEEEDEDSIAPIETREQTLKKQIKQFAEQNPEIAAQLVKTLLKGDEMGNA